MTTPRTLPLVLGVVAASALVALAAGGAGWEAAAGALQGMAPGALRGAGAAVAAVGVAGLLMLRRGRGSGRRPGEGDPAAEGLVTAAAILGVLAALSLVTPRSPGGADASDPTVGPGAPTTTTEPTPGPARPSSVGAPEPTEGAPLLPNPLPEPDPALAAADSAAPTLSPPQPVVPSGLLGRLADALLLVVLAAAWALARRSARRPAADATEEPPVAAVDAEAGLEASLLELEREGASARDRITAAYLRLLAALTDAGAPPRPYEAPHEHLHRALGPLGVDAAPLHRLADLYVAAHFGDRPVGDRERAAAQRALEAGLAGLRAAGRAGHAPERGLHGPLPAGAQR